MSKISLWWKIIAAILISWALHEGKAEIPGRTKVEHKMINSFNDNHLKIYNSLNKVSLTQKGYIQFLRYIANVPVITEFTFCLWLRSANLTYAHPLLSYSKHEEKRYIRAWISPHGKEINLAILENEVFKIPTYFQENRWYHICQSWDSRKGFWSFHLNGKLKLSSYEPQVSGLKIPGGGDIVVGQEYTDFDKGLDDGIEGDIFGFNLVLASTTTSLEVPNNFVAPYESGMRRTLVPNYNYAGLRTKPFANPYFKPAKLPLLTKENHQLDLQTETVSVDEVPSVLSYFTAGANRSPKGIFETGQNLFNSFLGWFEPPQRKIRIQTMDAFNAEASRRFRYYQNIYQQSGKANKRIISGNSRIVNDIAGVNRKPLGLQLVELSQNCALGRGAPINHEKVLVSWTKTPVRVFGGAILKNVSPFCFKT